MIIANLTRKLLQGAAKTLARYADFIEKYLAEKNLPDGELVSKISNDEPPSHWLAKVRQGAPHLLDQTAHESERANDHQGILLNSSNHSKKESEFSNNSIRQPFTRHTPKNLLETIKKYIYRPTLAVVRHSKSAENNEEDLPERELVSKISNNEPPSHWLAKVRQGAPHLLDQTAHESERANDHRSIQLNSSNHSKKESEFSNNSIRQPFTRHTPKNLHETIQRYIYHPTLAIAGHSKSADNNPEILNQKSSKRAIRNFFNPITSKLAISRPPKTALNVSKLKKASPPFQKADDGVGIKKKSKSQSVSDASLNPIVKNAEQAEKIHLYPKSQAQTEAVKVTQHNDVKKQKSEGIKQVLSSEDRKPKIPGTLQQKQIVLPGNNRLKENAYKQHITNNHRTAKTTDPLILNLRSKHFSQQHKSDKFQSGSVQWPSLPDETVTETDQDRWPQLPKQERFKSKDSGDNSLKFWQLQEQAQRNLLSEHEQRGKFWSE